MAKLIYAAITSLDGYVEDEEGRFDWAMPDEEVHSFVNDLERPIGIYLYGRRMYETMVSGRPRAPRPMSRQCSRTTPESGGQLRRSCTPGRFRRCPARGRGSSASSIETPFGSSSSPRWPTSQSGCRARWPRNRRGAGRRVPSVLVPDRGGRRQARPNVRAQLELLDERRFRNGVVHLHYRVRTEPATRRQAKTCSGDRASIGLARATPRSSSTSPYERSSPRGTRTDRTPGPRRACPRCRSP